MARRVETLAEFYRQNGWEEAARVLEADVQRFREAGMPDDLPSPRTRRKKEHITFTPLPIELKVRLFQILSEVQLPDTATHILQTDGLAERINQEVGQHVADDTFLYHLRVKGKGTYEEFGDEFMHLGEYSIDKRIVHSFNSALDILNNNKIGLVGYVREASLGDLMSVSYMGETRARFIKKALAPMNSSQGTQRRS